MPNRKINDLVTSVCLEIQPEPKNWVDISPSPPTQCMHNVSTEIPVQTLDLFRV